MDENSSTEVILYAVWQRYTYTIHFNNNGGTGIINDKTNVKAGEKVDLTGLSFTKANYTMLGWSENKDATVASIANIQLIVALMVSNRADSCFFSVHITPLIHDT